MHRFEISSNPPNTGIKNSLVFSVLIHLAILAICILYIQNQPTKNLQQPVTLSVNLLAKNAKQEQAVNQQPQHQIQQLKQNRAEKTPVNSAQLRKQQDSAINDITEQTPATAKSQAEHTELIAATQTKISDEENQPEPAANSIDNTQSIDQTNQPYVELNPSFRKPPIPPEYPLWARERNQQGIVLLQAYVLENGKTDLLRIIQSSGYKLLDKAAYKAVKQWEFMPAKRGEKIIAAWIQVPVQFVLN